MANESGILVQERPIAAAPSTGIHSRFLVAGGIRTHFLEAGSGFPVVLLHSGEFGGCAELSWEYTIGPLAEHFRVIAPDWAGFGKTEKVFSFEDMWGFRIRHITAFLQVLGLDSAHFIGNSMGGTLLLQVSASKPCHWPVKKAVIVSGGGNIPENPARETLNSYDGSFDHMRRIVETMFMNPQVRADSGYIERRHKLSQQPGAWESTAAARFRAPWRASGARMPEPPDYSALAQPILLATGEQDSLREPGFGPKLQKEIPGAELHVVRNCPHIDAPGEFNTVVLRFLKLR
jgi:2-hydroxymuconate-semialdehyde hydrolase